MRFAAFALISVVAFPVAGAAQSLNMFDQVSFDAGIGASYGPGYMGADENKTDPWFILPLLMTLSSLFQVWLNPTPPDPVQAKMMWIMPLAFSFMFFFFPAGLVLYWLTNNLLSIAQQWFINKKLGVQG